VEIHFLVTPGHLIMLDMIAKHLKVIIRAIAPVVNVLRIVPLVQQIAMACLVMILPKLA
jgi:hypothetical protein